MLAFAAVFLSPFFCLYSGCDRHLQMADTVTVLLIRTGLESRSDLTLFILRMVRTCLTVSGRLTRHGLERTPVADGSTKKRLNSARA